MKEILEKKNQKNNNRRNKKSEIRFNSKMNF